MFFVEGGGIPHEFEGRNGHLWNGLPSLDDVIAAVSNCVPRAIAIVTAVNLPADRIGTYKGSYASGTYDGEYVRVWSEHLANNVDMSASIPGWLELYCDACVEVYMDIVHGIAEESDTQRTMPDRG